MAADQGDRNGHFDYAFSRPMELAVIWLVPGDI
jgi:hypothetical protein